MKTLFLLALCAIAPSLTHASTILSDTSDLARYAPRSQPDAKLIEGVKSHDLFTKGAVYKSGLHEIAPPTTVAKGTQHHLAALMSDATGKLFYRKFDVVVGTKPGERDRRALSVDILGDIDLATMHFSVSTGLLDRMVVVEDAANGISLAFPLGVGGIDEAVMGPEYRILTPKFHGAHLDRAAINPSRTDPAYYRGRPFMPIVTARGSVTAIAFHITILGDEEAQQYGLNYLVRGFESHGCMRMREKDLMEFFTIVMNGADDKLPVNVDNHVWNVNAQGVRDPQSGAADLSHVYPFNNSSYMRVTRFPDPPFYKRDDIPNEHLVIMDRAEGQPDLRRFNALQPVMDELLPSGEADADLLFSKYLAP